MKIGFRQGIVSHQTLSNGTQDFIKDINGSGNLSLKANDRPTTITIAHAETNYLFTEDHTVENAWMGPFSPAVDYWLYWNFDQLTFTRTFGYTTLEPVVQNVEPGSGDVDIIAVIPGTSPSIGAFVVDGHFELPVSKQFDVVGSTNNDGTYTVASTLYNTNTGETQIQVVETVVAAGTDLGAATLDVDLTGAPLRQIGRHWYNTDENRHYVFEGSVWREVLRVFACQLFNGVPLSHSINAPSFIGTQIGDTNSVRAGRVIYDEAADVFRRDDRTFFTTEDQFFANATRVDAIRLESNVARAQFNGSWISEFSVVAFDTDGRIRSAGYNDAGSTVVGMLTEDLSLGEVGAVVIQGVISNTDWNWTGGVDAVPVGTPLWIEDGMLVPYDPHVYRNRTVTPIVGISNGSSGQYFEVAGAYATLGLGQIVSIKNNSSNNDGNYRVVSSQYNSTSDRTTVYVEEIIIDPIIGGEMYLTVGNYPIGQVPVARVLDANTVVFEQGLGGKGDRGPAGSIENMPAATTTTLGAVYLNLPADVAEVPLAVGDNDPRLSDPRPPLPHSHLALEVTFDPAAGITSTNVQYALEELGNSKLDKAGGTMTGYLTLYDDPIIPMHAATKQYVDSFVSGLVWLNPVCVVNMISDQQTTPPASPELGDSYIIPPGAVGVWAPIADGNVVTWDGIAWTDRGPLTGFSTSGARLGIAMQSPTVPSGTFAGHENEIALYDASGTFIGFEVPAANNAVYVCSGSDQYAYNQFAFSGTEWVLFGGAQPINPDEITITQNGNIISVIQFDDGGIVDARYWQNLEPSDLALMYAPISHTHVGTEITFTPYTSPIPGLGDIVATDVQAAIEEAYDEKAALQPTYINVASLPDATTYNGMIAHASAENSHYVAQEGEWRKLATYPLSIPYDIAYFLSGQMLFADSVVGSFIVTRDIALDVGLPGSWARNKTPATNNVTYDIVIDDGTTETSVGSLFFAAGDRLGSFTFTGAVTLAPGTSLEIVSPPTLDPTLADVSITIVGCATADECGG